MKVIWGCDFSPWIKERIPVVRQGFGRNAVTVGFGDEERLIAAVVFYDYTGRDLQISMAADHPKWATRENIKTILSYPFVECGCERITGTTTNDNEKMIRLFEGVGFKREGTVRKYFNADQDALIYGMLKHEARRWIR